MFSYLCAPSTGSGFVVSSAERACLCGSFSSWLTADLSGAFSPVPNPAIGGVIGGVARRRRIANRLRLPSLPRQRRGAPRAPRERQIAADSLYSGAMMMLSPYRPEGTARIGSLVPTAWAQRTLPPLLLGRIIFQQGDLRLTSGSTLKNGEFCTDFV